MLSEEVQSNLRLKVTCSLQGPLGDIIGRVAWAPDGETLAATAAYSYAVWFWHMESWYIPHKLIGHTRPVSSLGWSPDSQMLASGSRDMTIHLWDIKTGKTLQKLTGHVEAINSVAWSPDGRILASGSADTTVRLWDVQTGQAIREFVGHSSGVNSVVWSPDGQMLASGSADNTIRIWSIHQNDQLSALGGHNDKIFCVTWSPNGQVLASASADRKVHVWEPEKKRQTFLLEGHNDTITSISFSYDSSLMASKSIDNTVLIWRYGTWEKVALLKEPSSRYRFASLAFHPTKPILTTLDRKDTVLRIWNLDTSDVRNREQGFEVTNGSNQLLEQKLGGTEVNSNNDNADVYSEAEIVAVKTEYYTNAKIVLVGDSGVGKSGLGLVLTGNPFTPTESSHGRRVWKFSSHKATNDSGFEEHYEIFLWDLAGQPGYRLVHQLYLNELAVALVVFDAHSETDPFAGVQHWNRALRVAQQVRNDSAIPLRKFLVAARIDRGGVPVSRERVDRLIQNWGFEKYFETSAKSGLNIDELREEIFNAISWRDLPTVISTQLFYYIKDFLIAQKEANRLLSTEEDLYHAFLMTPQAGNRSDELRKKFHTCISLVESRGLIRCFSFGNLVLLQPELLDAYASALVNAAKAEPDGLGSILEEAVRSGNFQMPQDERINDKAQEEILLIATIEDLLHHEVVLREQTDGGSLLVFPSQLTREYPDLPDPEGKVVVFTFEGPVLNIYATLAVRLAHSGVFHKQEMWRNAVTYTARVGGTCGMVLQEIEEGRGKLTLFFKPDASEEIRFQFEEYVWQHLRRRSITEFLQRQRVFICPNVECGEALTERQVTKRRQFGYTSITCPVCEKTTISLLDREERLVTTRSQTTHEMDKAADDRRDDETEAFRRKGQQVVEQHEKVRSRLRHALFDSFNNSELRTLCFDLEIPFEDLAGEGKTDKIHELIMYFERRGDLSMLIAKIKSYRPHIDLN